MLPTSSHQQEDSPSVSSTSSTLHSSMQPISSNGESYHHTPANLATNYISGTLAQHITAPPSLLSSTSSALPSSTQPVTFNGHVYHHLPSNLAAQLHALPSSSAPLQCHGYHHASDSVASTPVSFIHLFLFILSSHLIIYMPYSHLLLCLNIWLISLHLCPFLLLTLCPPFLFTCNPLCLALLMLRLLPL